MSSDDIEKILLENSDDWFTITQMKSILGLNRHAILRGFRQLEIRDLVDKRRGDKDICFYWKMRKKGK